MKVFPYALREEVVSRLVAEYDPIQVVLFGSHAWGEPTEDSDVDLLIVLSPTESNVREAQSALQAHRALRGLRFSKDVLVETLDEFERAASVPSSLENRIKHEGHILYERGHAATGQVVAHEGRA